MINISVDTGRCVGAGQCVLTAPDYFDQDDDGIVTLLDPPDGADEDEVWQAGEVCPSRSITVTAN